MGATRLAAPVVAMAATPTGKGYWLVAADGGTFAFGDAAQVGNLTGVRFAAPPSSCASTASGKGLLIAAQDGGVFTLGDARFFGHAAA